MAKLGYARVSTTDQSVVGQIEVLEVAGCERIFAEQLSGKSTNGRMKKLLKAARPGDTVVVVKLERFARSSRDLFNLLPDLNELGVGFISPKVGFISPKDERCNTATSTGQYPSAPTIAPHPAIRPCYQLTVRKWQEHLARDS
jgi:DNA invertase Pin-like site-specific DNA recombinase